MANEQFIISTLNTPENKIKEIQALQLNGVFHFKITLTREDTLCPFCGGKTSIKEYKLRSYHHLPFAGIPSVIGIAVDFFVRTVAKPSLNRILLVLRTFFNPTLSSILLLKLCIIFMQLIRISRINSMFRFLLFSRMLTVF